MAERDKGMVSHIHIHIHTHEQNVEREEKKEIKGFTAYKGRIYFSKVSWEYMKHWMGIENIEK